MPDDRRPLEGIVVIDLGQIYNGPYASLLLALGGATVIKVEPPNGDLLRVRGSRVRGQLYPFLTLNSCKLGITLNLKTERGCSLLIELARAADVLVENFRPGVLDRLGVGSDVLQAAQPRLIFASGSGYGSSGPYRDYAAMDITVQAMSGVMSVTGWADRPPVKTGPAIADFLGGIHLYAAIVTALYEREFTGRGRRVEVSMHDSVFPSLVSSLGLYFGSDGQIPLRTGNRHNGLAEAPYNVYPARDGEVALIGVTDAHWRAVVGAMGREELADDPRFADIAARVANVDAVDELIAEFTSVRDRAELVEAFRHAGVPCAPVKDLGEVIDDPHLHARGMLKEIDHPELGRITAFNSPLRFDDDDPVPLRPSPKLGEHNDYVYHRWLGICTDELRELKAEGVI